MTYINKDKFIDKYNLDIPQIINYEFVADTETPVSTLLKVTKDEEYSFLLESVQGGDLRGRFSLLGFDPDIIWSIEKNKVKIISNDPAIDLSFLPQEPLKSLKSLINFSLFHYHSSYFYYMQEHQAG